MAKKKKSEYDELSEGLDKAFEIKKAWKQFLKEKKIKIEGGLDWKMLLLIIDCYTKEYLSKQYRRRDC